ncbi:hypothetical protein GCM10009623_15680 [Nocardioides aestuarii]|uniref:CPBP family intramembrane glutamic endopeptidase n=1 Tax=Nocardioides aestuarii TaxID=252231 RepID=A0ABW4TNM9_9ACTN
MRSTTPDHVTALVEDLASPAASRSEIRKELTIFGVVQLLLTVLTTVVGLQQGIDVQHLEDGPPLGVTALLLMALWPTVAALVARRTVHGRIRWSGWGLRRTTLRRLGAAWAVILLTVLASGVVLWATELGGLDLASDPVAPVLGLTVMVLPFLVLALGEELGWRGLVVTRLAQVSRPRTVVLATGIAWSAGHFQLLVLFGGTPEGVPTLYAIVMFTIALTALGAILASMQLHWGIWPACVAHAVWNATLYNVVEPVTVDGSVTTWFSTETGALLAASSVVTAVLWWRRYPLRRTPDGVTAVGG